MPSNFADLTPHDARLVALETQAEVRDKAFDALLGELVDQPWKDAA